MSFGTTLKQAREAQGLTTQDLSMRTKIRGDYLRALEDGNTSLLPERTFARSYLQRYARELGLDPTPLLTEFDRSVPASAEIAQSLRGAQPRSGAGGGLGPATLAGLLTGLIVLGAAGYYGYATYLRPLPTPAAVTPPLTAPAPTPAAPAQRTVRLSVSSLPSGARVFLDNRDLGATPLRSFPVDARDQAELRVELAGRQRLKQTISLRQGRNLRALLPVAGQGASALADLNVPARPATLTPAAPAPASSRPATPAPVRSPVSVTFRGESWTRVTTTGGQVLYQGTPPVGTVKGFPAGVVIRTGNAGAVTVSVNGAPSQAMGQAGQVLTKSY